MNIKLLLLSSSRPNREAPYFSHSRAALEDMLDGIQKLLFIPFAAAGGQAHGAYTEMIRNAFAQLGLPQKVEGIEVYSDSRQAIRNAEAVFVGGGNTFLLLHTLYDLGLMEPLRDRALGGMPYLGSSAGSNLAGRTINTSNDMAIIHPPSLNALDLLPFNINPHYPLEESKYHSGESRAERIHEFHCLPQNTQPVLSLYESSLLYLKNNKLELRGDPSRSECAAWLFQQGAEVPTSYQAGSDLSFLL